jgi:hypothetical protein
MRRVLLAMLALTTLAVVSCTKEKSFELGNGNTGGNTQGDLLTRVVIQTGPDSSTTFFSYDGSKRLLTETNKGPFAIVSSDSLQRVTRDAEGVIQTITVYPDAFVSDVYEFTMRYDATSKRYTAKLSFDNSGNVEDSIAYTYNTSGQIARVMYMVDFGSGYEPLGKDTIIYDGNSNVSKLIAYDYDGSDWEALEELAFTYDNKVNPLKLGQEAIVLERYQFCGNNNPTKISYVDYDTPALNQEVTLTYTYNAKDKPETASIVLPGAGGIALPVFFRYQ